jgi:endonuclease-3
MRSRSSALKPQPPRSAAPTKRAREIFDILERAHPEATCALDYRNAYELLVATILSAQCTDRRVNEVTPFVFARYLSAQHLAEAESAELEELIRSTGFYRAKAKSLITCAQALVQAHGGEVPREMEALVKLPGVGRKTANVVLGHAFGLSAGMAVDTHVLRVANRLDLAGSDEADEVERQLLQLVPRERWTRASDLLIFHGRKICAARNPACDACPVRHLCRWPNRSTGGARERRASGSASAGRARRSTRA